VIDHAVRIVRGIYHPRGPQDVPLEVDDWLGPVSRCMAEIEAERAQQGRPW